MKTLFTVPLIVFIAITFIPFPTSAQPSFKYMDECSKKLDNLATDIMGITKSIPMSTDDINNIDYIADIISYSSTEIDHLATLIFIRDLVNNASERSKIMQIVNLKTKHVIKNCSQSSESINRRMGIIKNPAALLICDHAKMELRKIQKMLQDSSTL